MGVFQHLTLQALYLPMEGRNPYLVDVPVVVTHGNKYFTVPEPAFPSVSEVEIQKSKISLTQSHEFVVYFRQNVKMSNNRALLYLVDNVQWRGDFLVVRIGVKGEPVGIHGATQRCMAEAAVAEFALAFVGSEASLLRRTIAQRVAFIICLALVMLFLSSRGVSIVT